MQLAKMKRLDIIIETAKRDEIIDMIRQSGATGYTLYPEVDGEGMRESREDIGFSHPHRNAGIFVIGPEPVIMEIVERISGLLPNHAGILFVSEVEVLRKGHFSIDVVRRMTKRFKGLEHE
jgi:nitrogen regulatory protein PII